MGSGLEGDYFVFPTMTALSRAGKLTNNKAKEFYKLRKLTLKLMWWPSSNSEGKSDIDWDWIKTLENRRIGELRIDEEINSQDNIRVIFFKANQPLPGEPMSRIWLLDVFAKKRQDFSTTQVSAWKAHRELILQRSYEGIHGA